MCVRASSLVFRRPHFIVMSALNGAGNRELAGILWLHSEIGYVPALPCRCNNSTTGENGELTATKIEPHQIGKREAAFCSIEESSPRSPHIDTHQSFRKFYAIIKTVKMLTMKNLNVIKLFASHFSCSLLVNLVRCVQNRENWNTTTFSGSSLVMCPWIAEIHLAHSTHQINH